MAKLTFKMEYTKEERTYHVPVELSFDIGGDSNLTEMFNYYVAFLQALTYHISQEDIERMMDAYHDGLGGDSSGD